MEEEHNDDENIDQQLVDKLISLSDKRLQAILDLIKERRERADGAQA